MKDFTARRTMMVDTQVRPSDVTKFPIIDAMLSVPREAFVPVGLREAAYVGENLALGGGRVMLEASGNMNRERLLRIQDFGLDVVSMGGLIHQATWADLSMKMA